MKRPIESLSPAELADLVRKTRAALGKTPVDANWTVAQRVKVKQVLKVSGLL